MPGTPRTRSRTHGALRRGLQRGLLLLFLALPGCATRWHYEKATADEVEMQQDREECARAAHVPFGSDPIELSEGRIWSFPFQTVNPKVLNDCMLKKGYTLLP